MRTHAVKLQGSTQQERQKLYDFLVAKKEPIYPDTELITRHYNYRYFSYNDSDIWAGANYTENLTPITISDFITKFQESTSTGDTMSTIKVGDVYINLLGETCTITNILTKGNLTTYTYIHQDGNTYPVGIDTIKSNWTKYDNTTSLYDRLVEPKTVVHCKTEDEARQLLNWAHDQGLKWSNDESYKEYTRYKEYTSNTCYDLKAGEFSRTAYFNTRNYTIIPFSSIPEFQSKETVKTKVSKSHTPVKFKEPVAQQEPIKSKSIKKEETFMSKLKATALTTVDQNKEAAIIAAKMEAGRVINKQVIKQAAKHVPFWAKGYLDTPLAPVVLANAVAMLGNHTGNAKVQKVSELMLLAAADVTVQSFNLDKIIDDVLSGVKLPAGILNDVE